MTGDERGKCHGVGQLLLDWGPGWMGIRHHEQKAGLQVTKMEIFYLTQGGLMKDGLYIV